MASVGSKGDSYDNSMVGALNSLFKAVLVRDKGPCQDINHLEVAVPGWVDRYNFRQLHGELGHVPSVEYERVNALAPEPEPLSISD